MLRSQWTNSCLYARQGTQTNAGGLLREPAAAVAAAAAGAAAVAAVAAGAAAPSECDLR